MASQSEFSRRVKLQGPKPGPLMVSKSSRKTKKQVLGQKHASPVVVYLRSPKVFHVRPEEFMGLVQHLTGNSNSLSAASSSDSCNKFRRPEMEKGTVDQIAQFEDFTGRVGPAGVSTDFHAFMQFVDFV